MAGRRGEKRQISVFTVHLPANDLMSCKNVFLEMICGACYKENFRAVFCWKVIQQTLFSFPDIAEIDR